MGEKPTEQEDAEARKDGSVIAMGGDEAGDDPEPAGLAVSDPGAPGTKGGSSKREGSGPPDPEPSEATNLNSSKSNVARQGGGPADPEPDEVTNLNSSRSN